VDEEVMWFDIPCSSALLDNEEKGIPVNKALTM
jgi:hypothetical protein